MWCASQASASPSHCSQVTSSWPSIIRQILMAPPRNRDKPKAPGAPGPSWGRCAPFWLAQALEGAAAVWRPETGRPIVAAHGRAEVAPAAGPVGATGDVVQPAGVRVRERGGAHRARVPRQCVDAGDDGRRHAGPAGLEPGAALTPKVWYIATPVAGSATALTSATVRPGQPRSVCHDGLGITMEQPLPVPRQTVSAQPRRLVERTRRVSPTAVTYCDDAGNESPRPESPTAAVIACPGWLKAAL